MAETQAGMGSFIGENIRRRPYYSKRPSSVSTPSKSDNQSGISNEGADHMEPVEMPGDSDPKVSQDMQWQLHLQTQLGNQRDFACEKVNTPDVLHEPLRHESDGAIKQVCASYSIEDANTAPQKPCEVYPATMKYEQDVQILGIEAILNDDSHRRPKSKNQAGVYFSDSNYTELNITDCLLSDQDKSLSSGLKSHHVGFYKAQPWWRATGKDDLAAMVSQKSQEHLENCDLPQPLTKYFRAGPVIGAKFVNHNQRFSNMENRTFWNFSAIYSSQDSDKHLSMKVGPDMADTENIKTELLEALRNSQTRAREAEKAAEQAHTEKEHVTTLLFRQASQLFAYKQWFYLLQLENLRLQLMSGNQKMSTIFPAATPPWVPWKRQLKERVGRGRKRKSGINRRAIAFAVGLGLVGAGLLLGWTTGWLLPPV